MTMKQETEYLRRQMEQWKYCLEHGAFDTNLDGDCVKFSTATRPMKEYLQPCRLVDQDAEGAMKPLEIQ